MDISRYSGKIVCKRCGKNFKTKKERKKIKYICSGYDRFGKEFCKREIVTEKMLDDLITFHYKKKLTDEEISMLITSIEIHNDKWLILYIDGTETLLSHSLYKV
jgi:site-specific DNA recombinase